MVFLVDFPRFGILYQENLAILADTHFRLGDQTIVKSFKTLTNHDLVERKRARMGNKWNLVNTNKKLWKGCLKQAGHEIQFGAGTRATRRVCEKIAKM
jgi:hypothetical protein